LDTYYFERLKIQEVCVTPDGQRLIGYGISTASRDDLRPNKCRAEKLFFGICPFQPHIRRVSFDWHT